MVFNGSATQIVQLMVSIGLVLATMLLGRWLIGLLYGRLLKTLPAHLQNGWLGALAGTIRQTGYYLLLTLVAEFALLRLDIWAPAWRDGLDGAFFVVYFLVIFAFVWRSIGVLADWLSGYLDQREDIDFDSSMLPFLKQIVLFVVILIGLIILADFFGVDATGLIATLGVGSLAIALAAQEAFTDAISGIMLNLDRPFRVGDRIELQELDTVGDVVDIGIRSTRLVTLDNRTIVVPNSVIAKQQIVNLAYPGPVYRLDLRVGVAYGSDIEQVREVIVTAVSALPGVMSQPGRETEALFVEMADSALVFEVHAWLPHYRAVPGMVDQINTAVYKALNAAGIEIPFPQRDVHVKLDDALRARLTER